MMSAVDAAVEAKKAEKQGQGRSTAEKTPSSKKKGLLRFFSDPSSPHVTSEV
jgi:hypothetical protein